MKASEELTDEQTRQVLSLFYSMLTSVVNGDLQLIFDVEHAYAEFFRSLGGEKDAVS
jgi:ESCRT-I complex subunit VPS28